MSIETTRCWHVTGLQDDETYDSPCHPDASHADMDATALRAEGHKAAAHARRDHSCLWAECDACGMPLDDYDLGSIVHAPDRAALDVALTAEGWIVTTDGGTVSGRDREHVLRSVVCRLAAVHADHPDYRQEWRSALDDSEGGS